MMKIFKGLVKGLVIGVIVISTIFVCYSECKNMNELFAMVILFVLFDCFSIGQILGIKSDEF